jgi:hypothetical protein
VGKIADFQLEKGDAGMGKQKRSMKRCGTVALALVLVVPVLSPGRAESVGDSTRKIVEDPYDHRPLEEIDPAQRARVRGYSPYAGRKFPTRALFGDTHHHTANSGDAFMGGNRLSPEQAYRFARGEQVVTSSGVPARLSRPLDFLVVTDHAEGLGVMFELYDGNPVMLADPTLARWAKALKQGGEAAADAVNEVVSAQAGGTLPKAITDPETVGPAIESVWRQYTEIAEAYNEPGRFTAMIGYEWTTQPRGDNLHRNIMFRDGKDKADMIVPFSAWQSEDPEKLWEWMAGYEAKTGGRLLAIPHNANLSNGSMFAVETADGKPLSLDYAARRSRWEPLQEIIQTKGASETHPTLSPNDEFSGDLGVAGWDNGNLTMEGKPETPEMRPYMYLRSGLMRGLELEETLGVNPFKFGFVAGSDVHNSISSIEEDNFFGKHVIQEPNPGRWDHVSKRGFGETRYTWHYMAAGYAAVWAVENTREAIWDAMFRREVYGTSGTRVTLRFFGGWGFGPDDANTRYIADIGYAKGVPMGSDLPGSPEGKTPTFLVAALKDPLSGNLDRIQIVKGWLGEDGKARERVYDAVWSDADRREPGPDGKLTPVGDTVDLANATWTDSIGDPSLATVWTDPDFDPTRRAFYYARVIEIPTPRWTAYDALRFGIEMSPDTPMKQRERAWSSPIWYAPAK